MTDPGASRVIKVLFLCHYNRHRSATAERLFCKRPDLEVRSAGTSPDALVRINERMLAWADIVFVMDEEQLHAIETMFPGHAAFERTVCLQIEDVYSFLDPRLIELLTDRVPPHLDRLRVQHQPGP